MSLLQDGWKTMGYFGPYRGLTLRLPVGEVIKDTAGLHGFKNFHVHWEDSSLQSNTFLLKPNCSAQPTDDLAFGYIKVRFMTLEKMRTCVIWPGEEKAAPLNSNNFFHNPKEISEVFKRLG